MDIDLEGQLPLVIADLAYILEACLMRRVVDEDVDATKFAACGFDDVAAMLGILQIARDEDGLSPCLFDPLFGFACVFVLVEIGDENIRTLAGIGNRNGPRPMPLSPPVMTAFLPVSRPDPR